MYIIIECRWNIHFSDTKANSGKSDQKVSESARGKCVKVFALSYGGPPECVAVAAALRVFCFMAVGSMYSTQELRGSPRVCGRSGSAEGLLFHGRWFYVQNTRAAGLLGWQASPRCPERALDQSPAGTSAYTGNSSPPLHPQATGGKERALQSGCWSGGTEGDES